MIASDNAADAALLTKHFSGTFDKVCTSTNPDKVVEAYEHRLPQVLALALEALAKAERLLVPIDGYRRIPVLRRLGRDTARLQCSAGAVGQALAQWLTCPRPLTLAVVEQALLLSELIKAQYLPQREAARQCGCDPSSVQRRLRLQFRA